MLIVALDCYLDVYHLVASGAEITPCMPKKSSNSSIYWMPKKPHDYPAAIPDFRLLKYNDSNRALL
jgi:hypothetical protein